MSLSCLDARAVDRVTITKIDATMFPAKTGKTVSVIIPTRNAGPEFVKLLQAIRSQRKVDDVEILVLDSASSDDTVAVAEAHGARVIPVDPATFSHGGTRNLGASLARGAYLVFLVQDAMPINVYWLYRLTAPLEADPELVALCTRQVLPPDADVPFLARTDHHDLTKLIYDFQAGDYTVCAQYSDEWWEQLPDYEKRRLPFFDDVCSCIRADFFQQEPFLALVNAEDIEYGFRLLKMGYKRGFIHSTGVYHFHDRGPVHQLKTQYLGCIALSELLGTPFLPTWQIIAPSFAQLRQMLTRQLDLANFVLDKKIADNSDAWADACEKFCTAPSAMLNPSSTDNVIDCCPELASLRQLLDSIFPDSQETNTLTKEWAAKQEVLPCNNWMQQSYFYPYRRILNQLGHDNPAAFIKTFTGLLGRFLGAQLATFVLWDPATPEANRINAFLEEGICRAEGLCSAHPEEQSVSLATRLTFDRQALLRQAVCEIACKSEILINTTLLLEQLAPTLDKTEHYLDSLLNSDAHADILPLPRTHLEDLTRVMGALSQKFKGFTNNNMD